MQLTSTRRRVIGWIGIALILLNVLAPTLAHAVRGPGVPGVVPAWCAMGVVQAGVVQADVLQVGPDVGADDPASDPSAELVSSSLACPFCASAPAALALPAQPPAALPQQAATAAPRTAEAPLPAEAPASHAIQARAPPRG
ncbi:DUF2946 family protein [Leptothrix discophora]|uniref:DUF2946 family protein n=1 Tax=Leptothrix discophora TaxID=89 RepID=A0ABT9FZC1_LEPDI|nr:DUF2946 family protein [Leptothrix discophora]MDP4299575.1 DUF2946 family protein [Leptothrix discophora]